MTKLRCCLDSKHVVQTLDMPYDYEFHNAERYEDLTETFINIRM